MGIKIAFFLLAFSNIVAFLGMIYVLFPMLPIKNIIPSDIELLEELHDVCAWKVKYKVLKFISVTDVVRVACQSREETEFKYYTIPLINIPVLPVPPYPIPSYSWSNVKDHVFAFLTVFLILLSFLFFSN